MGEQLDQIAQVLKRGPDETADLDPVDEAFLKPLALAVKYVRTWRAVWRGERLYELTPDALKENRYLTPWAFLAVTQALCVGFTGLVGEPLSAEIKGGALSTLWASYFERSVRFVVPISMVASAWISARVSLKRADVSAANIVRARKAYIYIYGALGFGISATFDVITRVQTHGRTIWDPPAYPSLSWAGVLVFACFLFMSGRYVFAANGYASRRPWGRFIFLGTFQNFLAIGGIVGVAAGIAFVAAATHRQIQLVFAP
jgi:hypothetical protein